MPHDFPTAPFERTYARTGRLPSGDPALEHFTAAWNAISFRFVAMCADGDEFTASVGSPDAPTSLEQRYQQEHHIFGFFSNGFSAFEAYFYGLYAVGALLQPGIFQIATPKEQQAVSPASTIQAYARAFAGDPILVAFQVVMTDWAYREWKEIRNILTHRTAPGRTIFVSIDTDQVLAPRWKINNIPLDRATAATRRGHSARLLNTLFDASAIFVESRIR